MCFFDLAFHDVCLCFLLVGGSAFNLFAERAECPKHLSRFRWIILSVSNAKFGVETYQRFESSFGADVCPEPGARLQGSL